MSAKDQIVPERNAFEEWQDGKAVYQMTAWDIWLAATAAEREACAVVLRDKYNELARRSYPPPKILLELEAAILERSNDPNSGAARGPIAGGLLE